MAETISAANEAKWQAQYERLRKYVETHDGHVPYPRRGQESEIEHIGQWVRKQRKAYSEDILPAHRRDLLIAISPQVLNPILNRRKDNVDPAIKAGIETARFAIKRDIAALGSEPIPPDQIIGLVDEALDAALVDVK